MVDIQPQDVLVLIGLLLACIYDPFSAYVSYTSYEILKKKIAGAPQRGMIFGLVWYVLYALLATSVFLVYLERNSIREWVAYAEFGLFGAILFLTKVWSPLFFGFTSFTSPRKQPTLPYALALLDIVLLIVCVICYMTFSIVAYASFDAFFLAPALLMLPMLIWLAFASYLNGAALLLLL